jgi:glycosyltransferase involved in cell wall biosynthesis
MRVTLVSMDTHHRRDTPETRRRYRFAKRLLARGHAVTICCRRWWDGDHPAFEQDGIEYRAVVGEHSGGFGSKLPFVLRKADPDVVHVPNSPVKHARAAARACRLLRVPLVVRWWTPTPEAGDAAARKLARRAARVIVPSQLVETVVREYGTAEADVTRIPEGIDFPLIEETPPEDRFDLVTSGRLDGDTDVETFLLALAELRGRDWQAAVIGEGPALETAVRTAADLRIDDRVAFLGDLSDRERVAVCKGAHVFTQTDTVAPFATELLWALACGCVGIAQYHVDSAAHELVEEKSRLPGTRGELVSSPQELAAAIDAAGDHEHRTVDEAYDRYDHDTVVSQYVGCYQKAIEDYGLF